MHTKLWIVGAAAASLCSAAVGQTQSSLSAAGRKVVAATGPAVVTIRLVKKTTSAFEGQSSTRDSQSEVPGVVISPDGLTVTSLAAGDPSSAFSGAAGEGSSTRSDITEAKLLLAGGDEVPMKVVLRDKDFDLLFLRPVSRLAQPMHALNLHDSTTVGLLDPVLLLTRMGKVVNRTLGAKLLYVQGVMDKPRRRYIVSNELLGGDFGSPILALNGKVVGLLVVKVARMGTDTMDSPRSLSEGMASVVVTAADLLKIAVQAPQDAPGRTSSGSTGPAAPPHRRTGTRNR